MTATHVPVLLHETVDLLAPPRGGVAVDCTFGAGGHARASPSASGPTARSSRSTAIPIAEARFDEFAAEVACATRFVRADFVEGLAMLADEDVRADAVLMDLGMSSMQVDTRERGFSYAYDAPLDMRMDPTLELSAREVVNEWDERASLPRAARPGRGALRPPDRPRDRARTCARRRSRRRPSWSTSSPPRSPRRRGSRAAIRPSAPSRRSGSPSTTSSDSSTRRCRSRGACWHGGRFAGISFHSLEDGA